MPEEVVIAIGSYLTEGELILTAAEAAAITTVITTVAATVYAAKAQRDAQAAAKDAYNAGLRDRYIMTRGAAEARQIVLGRARTSGPMFFVGSYGANREHLTFIVALAGHEIDAVEQIYFDDMPVVIDGSGNVLGVTLKEAFTIAVSGSVAFTINSAAVTGTVTAQAAYGTTIVPLTVVSVVGTTVTVSGATNGIVGVCEIRYRPNPSPFNPRPSGDAVASVALDGSGNGSVTISPDTTRAFLGQYIFVTDGANHDLTSYASLDITGTILTVTGSPFVSITATVYYTTTDLTSRARVRTYLGAAGEVADAATITNFPGVWTSAHVAKMVAKLVVELDYDPTAFPSGIPNVSAMVRGAKVLDPRTGVTAWSDNPALLTRHYALSPLGGRLTSDLVNDADVIVAANVCDTSTNYIVNGQTYTRPLYRAGTVAKSIARPQDVITDLTQAMAGKWVFNRGQLRIKAGSFTTPLQTLDESWLHEAQQVHVQPHRSRSDVFNAVSCSYADEAQNYQVVPMPRLVPAAYVTEDGAELPLDMTLASVQFSGQAQHVAGCLLRDSRASIQLTVLCNMRAYTVEVFDVIYVSLSRFGWVKKTFEVLDRKWTLTGGIQLALKETDATINAVGTPFTAYDAGKATRLPSPFKVAAIAGLAVTSGAGVMPTNTDGTVVQRMLATWTAATDPGILDSNGGIEVRYGLATLPDSQWTSVFVDGAVTQAYLPGVQFGKIYLVKARGFNALSTGNWNAPVLHKVVGNPLAVTKVLPVYVSSVNGGIFHNATGHLMIDGKAFTPDRDCAVEVSCTYEALGAASWDAQRYVTVFCDATSDITGGIIGGSALFDTQQSLTTVRAAYSNKGTFAVTGGVNYTVGLASHENPVSTGNQIWNLRIYVTQIYN